MSGTYVPVPVSVIAAQAATIIAGNAYAGVDLSDASVTPPDMGRTQLLSAAISQRPGISLSASNATGNGVTDDSVAINTFLASFTAGARVSLPPGKFYLINSGNLVVPAGVTIEGAGNPFALGGAAMLAGCGFLLNPAYSIVMRDHSTLRGVRVLRPGLMSGPTAAEAIASIATWGAENSVGISIPPNINGVVIHDVGIVGFNTAIKAQAGDFHLHRIWIDCYNGVAVTAAGDNHYLSEIRCEPFYCIGGGVPAAGGTWDRPGVAFNLYGGNTGGTLDRCFSFMWRTGLVINAIGVTQITGCGFEVQASLLNGANSNATAGVVFTSGTHSSEIIIADCYLNGFGTGVSWGSSGEMTWTGGSIIVANDGHAAGHVVTGAGQPVYGGFYNVQFNLGGNTAAPPIFTVASGAYAVKIVSPFITNGTLAGTWISLPGGATNNQVDIVNAHGVNGGAPTAATVQTHFNEKVWATSDSSVAVIDGSPSASICAESSTSGAASAQNLALWRSGTQIGSLRTVPAGGYQPATILQTDLANGSLVLAPSGTGAIMAQVPDGTAAGGSSRGGGVVDLQTTRSSASQVASGGRSAIVGGGSNTASSTFCVVGGNSNNVSGGTSVAFGFANQLSGANSSAPGGANANDHGRTGVLVWSSNASAISGTQQSAKQILGGSSNGTTPVRLTADGQPAGAANTVNIPSNTAVAIRIVVVGRHINAQDVAAWRLDPVIVSCGGGTSTVTVVGGGTAIAPMTSTGSVTGWSINVTADTANGGLNITATGASGYVIDWTAEVSGPEAG